MATLYDNGKPDESRGRKATGLKPGVITPVMIAGLPKVLFFYLYNSFAKDFKVIP